ncbi:phosphoadenylyl-sulfate reductase [Pelagibacterium montanilacus]|uniref:phosphoadenylyl-sulfate reductase n=1 Tax=Pelagibacterium montanilacus TaxID=2185280 RepID=UPI000F8E28FD|nr:phosphoadenylyl-sulfate reductase [Pelagibacterium montanilacus]
MAMADPVPSQGPDKLRALGIVALNGMFDEMDAEGVLRQAAEDILPADLALVSSFGADSAVLLHIVSRVDPSLPVYFLETGKHFAETLEYVEQLKAELGLTNVIAVVPDPADLARFDPTGELWETDPDSCCHIRKTEPLEKVLSGYGGWVTGRKRFQTAERGVLPHFELTSDNRIKVNPLAYYTHDDIEAYKHRYGLPDHPLYHQGYKSIGCAPCTSAVAEGEDPRAGRWRGLDKRECGIHFDFNGQIAPTRKQAGKTKEMRLFKNGGFMADPWTDWVEALDPAEASYTHVPLDVFVAHREAFIASPHPLGLRVDPGHRVEDVEADMARFSSVAISFPAFGDGRGFSSARLVRERFGFQGEVRAVGDILADQVPFLRRCGIDAFVVANPATRQALENDAFAEVSLYYQPVGTRAEVPVGTRPFLRRALADA